MGNAPLHFNAWQHYRHTLAARLSDADWEIVRDAMKQTQMMSRVHAGGIADRHFTSPDVYHLEEARSAVGRAIKVLESHSTENG